MFNFSILSANRRRAFLGRRRQGCHTVWLQLWRLFPKNSFVWRDCHCTHSHPLPCKISQRERHEETPITHRENHHRWKWKEDCDPRCQCAGTCQASVVTVCSSPNAHHHVSLSGFGESKFRFSCCVSMNPSPQPQSIALDEQHVYENMTQRLRQQMWKTQYKQIF